MRFYATCCIRYTRYNPLTSIHIYDIRMHSSLSLSAHSRVASSVATLPRRVHASPLLTSCRALNGRYQHAQPVSTSSSQHAAQGVVEQPSSSSSSSLPDTASIWFKSLPSVGDLHNAGTLVPLVLLSLALLAEPAMAQEAQHHAGSLAMPQFDLAEDTSFLQNVARYGKYFVTVSSEQGMLLVWSSHVKLRT